MKDEVLSSVGAQDMDTSGYQVPGVNDFEYYWENDQLDVSSSRRVSWSIGGGWRSLCIKIGYSEPTRAESREGTSTRAESSRVT